MHGRILRPLLSLHKADLSEVCRSAGLPWAEDPTNADTAYARNKMRVVLSRAQSEQSTLALHQQKGDVKNSRSECSRTRELKAAGAAQPDLDMSFPGEGGSMYLDGLPGSDMQSLDGTCNSDEKGQAEQNSELGITADVLRLVGACSEASAILSASANALRRAAASDATEDWSECFVDTATVLSSSKGVAVRALAAVLQVNPCLFRWVSTLWQLIS